MSNKNDLPSYDLIQGALGQGPSMNSRRNIIAGPAHNEHWNHSPGLEKPDVAEEGPLPIMGNIGELIKQEADDYSRCSNNINIGLGPNCSGAFVPDIYTFNNTCGDKCVISYPESIGIQNFGIDKKSLSSIPPHGLHAYQNVRVASEGLGLSNEYGCYEMIPNLKRVNNSCQLDYKFEGQTTGDFTKLSNWQSFINKKH